MVTDTLPVASPGKTISAITAFTSLTVIFLPFTIISDSAWVTVIVLEAFSPVTGFVAVTI